MNVYLLRRGLGAFCAALAVSVICAAPAEALFKQEQKCVSKLGKAAGKLASTVAKETGKCLDSDISGKDVGACPNAKNTAKIAKAAAKVVSSAEKSCFSTCSGAPDVTCVSDLLCPPPSQQCSAGAKAILFDIDRVNFPGPYCPTVGVTEILSATDIGTCTSSLADQAGDDLLAAIYGSVTNATGISGDAASCLAAISKSAQKLTSTVAKSVAKCRDSVNKGKLNVAPTACATADAKTAAKIDKAEQKLIATIASKCTDGNIAELDICGAGLGGTATIGDAQTCMVAAAKEVGDSQEASVSRTTASVSIIDSAYPPGPTCGDGAVNDLPNANNVLGEECDGDDDAACPGACLPPGDEFECTCGDKVRYRFLASAADTDSDAGWTGNSLKQTVGDRSGFMVTLLNCDCAGFDGPGSPNCTGGSVDPICDMVGKQRPYCEWEVGGPHCEGDITTDDDPCATNADCGAGTCVEAAACDANGMDPDLINEDEDCAICDGFAGNPGDFCQDDSDCTSQCYPEGGGAATGGCSFQSECAAGEVCRGRCDTTPKCIKTPDGAPFAVQAANAGVCSATEWRNNIVGTINLETGEHNFQNESFSRQYLGEQLTRPCPVCGGFCEGGVDNLSVCLGRCRDAGGGGSLDECRFQSDCTTPGETCSGESPDCRDGGTCNLNLICGGAPETPGIGEECTITFVDDRLGAMSGDCPPADGNNITGQGFPIAYAGGATSSSITVVASEPCTAPGFELYDCHCPGGSGQATQPNNCAPACDSGANFGIACGGLATTCSGGVNSGAACDEDADCPGAACDANPLACNGDPTTDGLGCTTNGDCGLGTCGDACPTGRCVPLCVDKPGDFGDGICATSTDFVCDGNAGFTCTEADAIAALAGDCSATCSGSGDPCSSITDCPSGETCNGECNAAVNCESGGDNIVGNLTDRPGAGTCVEVPRKCTMNSVTVEGGTTLNGQGSAADLFHVGSWCFTATNSAAVNATSGFPGPGIIERKGQGLINQTSIP